MDKYERVKNLNKYLYEIENTESINKSLDYECIYKKKDSDGVYDQIKIKNIYEKSKSLYEKLNNIYNEIIKYLDQKYVENIETYFSEAKKSINNIMGTNDYTNDCSCEVDNFRNSLLTEIKKQIMVLIRRKNILFSLGENKEIDVHLIVSEESDISDEDIEELSFINSGSIGILNADSIVINNRKIEIKEKNYILQLPGIEMILGNYMN